MAQHKETESKTIPRFSNEAEAGEFWDTHSPLDFGDDFKPVDTKFARQLIKRGLTVKLSEESIGELREVARERGIGPSTLARMWILERLRGVTHPH
ncbi:MAG: CopG family antitoxin [Chloroflexota bacterium]